MEARESMNEELRSLLSSISHMAEHGEIPVHAFSSLIASARGELVAEHLHQRWLADGNFAKIAAEIVLQMHGVENRNLTICSEVLSLALRDYRTRRRLRKQSRLMFRNYVCTLISLYPAYKQIDKCLSACLIEPLFKCLQMLVEETPDADDLKTAAQIVIGAGAGLSQLNPSTIEQIVMRGRHWLVSNRLQLDEDTKRLLLNAFDLWTYGWDARLYPDCLRRYYEEEEQAAIENAEREPKPAVPRAKHSKHSKSTTKAKSEQPVRTQHEEEEEEEIIEEREGESEPASGGESQV